jgi:hypothetical protein
LIAVILFVIYLLIQHSPLKASISALIFLVFFNLYGFVFVKIVKIDIIQVEHYTLVPFLVLCAVYATILISTLPKRTLRHVQTILMLTIGMLVIFNLISAVPAELAKNQSRVSAKQAAKPIASAQVNYPDIYFIIFDEYAGFDAVREYWKDTYYEDFTAFLKKKGFFIAEHSHSETTDTLREIASRLNLKSYPMEQEDYELLFNEIAHNRVMRILKTYGYTTVVFDGPSILYPTKTTMDADYNLRFDTSGSETDSLGLNTEFTSLYFDQTMLRWASQLYTKAEVVDSDNSKMVGFSINKASNLPEVQTPKFVYLHVMLPHLPIIYDENGGRIDPAHRIDWNYYLGQHKFATKMARQVVDQILKNADPKRPPIIVLQSDHGARNLPSEDLKFVPLENYADKYKTNIMNAVYLPGFDYSQLSDDFPPIETFAIILNHYFNAGVTVEKTQPK